MKMIKAATKTGFRFCRPEKDPLCCEGPASVGSPHPFRAALRNVGPHRTVFVAAHRV